MLTALIDVSVFGGTPTPTGECFSAGPDKRFLLATFIYPVVVDLIVLILAAYKLVLQSRSYHRRSRLTKFLFQDGFIYFIIVSGLPTDVCSVITHEVYLSRFVINVPTAVIAYLQLDPLLYALFGLPAAILTIVRNFQSGIL